MRTTVEVEGLAVQRGRVEAPDAPGYALAISGSLPDRGTVQARVEGAVLAEAPIAADGTFAIIVNTLTVAPSFALELSAERGPIATMSARRVPLPPPPAAHLEPIVLPGMGRSGSSWLVRLLGGHPDVVAHRSFELEPRAVAYWANVVRALAEPASHWQLLARGGEPRWWLGDGDGVENLRWVEHELREELGRAGVEDLCRLAQRRVELFYRAAGALAGREAPRFFVEKTERDWDLLRLIAEIWPGSRDVILVRDFRDTIASALAFNEKKGTVAFGRQRVATDEDYLVSVRDYAESLLDWERSRGSRAWRVRYEDLVLEPERTLTGLLRWLGLDAAPAVVADVVAAASRDTPQMIEHRTAPSPRESIGRWRRDLPAPLRDRASAVLAEVLGDFGYDV